jgi:uncharacterized membrane protein YkvA (DUF1232 family)
LGYILGDFLQINHLVTLAKNVWKNFRIRIFLLAGFAFLYLLSPFDIVPEVAFGLFGLLDDLVSILRISVSAKKLPDKFLA